MALGPDADAVELPDTLRPGIKGGPEYSTTIITMDGGREQRNQNWGSARSRWTVSARPRTPGNFETMVDFFRDRRGKERAFTFHDPIEDRDVIARFDTDQMIVDSPGTGISTWSDIPIIEVRDSSETYAFPEPERDDSFAARPLAPVIQSVYSIEANNPVLAPVPAGTYYLRFRYQTFPGNVYGAITGVYPITVPADVDRWVGAISEGFDFTGVSYYLNIYAGTSPTGPFYHQQGWGPLSSPYPDGWNLQIFDYETDVPMPGNYAGSPDAAFFPFHLTRVAGGPGYRTIIQAGSNAYEKRTSHWETERRRFTLEHDKMSAAQADDLLTFFRAHRGKALPFLVTDPVTGEIVFCRFDSDYLEITKQQGFSRAFSLEIVELVD